MSKIPNQIPIVPGNITFYTMEKAECFRACFDHEYCHYITTEIFSNGFYCMIYLIDGLVEFSLKTVNKAAFYTIECAGNACIQLVLSSFIIWSPNYVYTLFGIQLFATVCYGNTQQ